MTENEPNSHIALEWFDGYHGGWAGNHFDQIVMRIVEEGATRRQLLESGEADAPRQVLPRRMSRRCRTTRICRS